MKRQGAPSGGRPFFLMAGSRPPGRSNPFPAGRVRGVPVGTDRQPDPQGIVNERDLIARVLSGDPSAERQLYDRYVDQVWRMAYRFAGDSERAAEWTQDTFVRVFQRLGEFRGEARLGTWIGSITISIALTGLRQGKRRAEREVPLEDDLPHPAPSRPRVDGELRQKLAQAIENLADGYRSVFVLHDVEGYTHEEIAAMLGVTTGTSKAQLHRARGKLREALGAYA